MSNIQQKLFDRLFKAENSCLEFMGARDTDGYGIVWWEGRNKGAHILAYEYYHGPVPKGMLVCHLCDNPPCCNDSHLFLGTRQINYDDMIAKGRQYILKGEELGNSSLTEDRVREIRLLYSQGYSQRSLGRQFGVTHTCIGYVVRRESWRHVE